MKKNTDTVLTGDRPTGRLHLGHYLGSIKNRLELQEKYPGACYYMVADLQALTDNADNPEKVRSNVIEVALDNLACGIDPEKTTFFIQSQIPEIGQLTMLFMNLVTLARLRRNPTVKDEMNQKGYGEDVPAGFLTYPVSQAADILICKANIVPVGEDQLPVIEQDNEIIQKFNNLYGDGGKDDDKTRDEKKRIEIFQKIKPIVSTTPRLVGVDGNAKMSKSLNNAIYLADSAEEIEKKVMSMYTDPGHIHASDSGKIEGNVVFTYLDIFDQNKNELAALKAQYTKGGLGDVIIKKRLVKILQDFLQPLREKREGLAKDPEKVLAILKDGTKRVKKIAEKTLNEVRQAIKIDYFG